MTYDNVNNEPDTKEDDFQDEPQDVENGTEEALTLEAQRLKEKLLRTMADLENVRKRSQKEKADTAKYAISSFAKDMLVVSDNLRRALLSIPTEDVEGNPQLKGVVTGVLMTEKELLNVLKQHGVEEVPAMGEKFDHNVHQAMFEAEKEDIEPGIVIEVMQAGYKINDRLLRPAMVGVSN